MSKHTDNADPLMGVLREWFERSGLSLHDMGLRMGYDPSAARQCVWQFMRSADPHLSMLRRFASALGITIADLVEGRLPGPPAAPPPPPEEPKRPRGRPRKEAPEPAKKLPGKSRKA